MQCLCVPQECEQDMAKGLGGTGEGFDAPSAGRAGAKGFGGHNVSAVDLRSAMVKVSLCRMWA